MTLRSFAMLVPIFGLGACELALPDDDNDGGAPQTYDQMLDDGFAIAATVEGQAPVDPSTLPTTGTVGYGGYWSYYTDTELTDDPTAIGNLDLTVDFAGVGNVQGRIDNVTLQNGAIYDGTLLVAGGAIDRTAVLGEPTFVASVVGDLTLGLETTSLNGSLEGSFFGDDAQVVGGGGGGTAISTDENFDWDSIFVADVTP